MERKSKLNYYLFWTSSYIFIWLHDLSSSYINFVCFFSLFNPIVSHNLTVYLIDFASNGTNFVILFEFISYKYMVMSYLSSYMCAYVWCRTRLYNTFQRTDFHKLVSNVKACSHLHSFWFMGLHWQSVSKGKFPFFCYLTRIGYYHAKNVGDLINKTVPNCLSLPVTE